LSSVKVAYEKKITEGQTADNSEATCLPAKAGKHPGFLFLGRESKCSQLYLMPDVHSKEIRSYNMSRIKGKNTKPEMLVRKFLHANGYRYKLHDKSLPGKPDIVLPNIERLSCR
jgi:hypothetical protein